MEIGGTWRQCAVLLEDEDQSENRNVGFRKRLIVFSKYLRLSYKYGFVIFGIFPRHRYGNYGKIYRDRLWFKKG